MVFRKVVDLMMGCLGLAKQPTQPAPAESSESMDVTEGDCKRIRLGDGRFLAYTERGVPKHLSNYRVVVVHGFGSSKEMNFNASEELLDELKIYLLLFDRAGYGDSDPNPKRSLKSEASDIEELADKLQLGAKFYVLGVSLGCYPVWSCLKWIPNRLSGSALVVPFINYRWPSLPRALTKNDYRKRICRWTFRGLRYAPCVFHWWLTQKIFPSSNVLDRNPAFFCSKDLETLRNTPGYQLLNKHKIKDPTVFNSIRRDVLVAFGKWDFEPTELSNPYPEMESLVHIWQGHEDRVVPFQLQRYIHSKLPWIQYHEVREGGHLLVYDSAVCEAILKSLVLGDDPPLYRPIYEPDK